MHTRVFSSIKQRNQLACLEIRHPLFKADILLQGAQLIYFKPEHCQDNWLWLSPEAKYQSGTSVRGGIPVCWPWFGNADKNPASVQQHISDPHQAAAHGFARTQLWELMDIEESCDQVQVSMRLPNKNESRDNPSHWHGQATLEAQFVLTAHECRVSLITTNSAPQPLTLSQALHTYLPTSDISNTKVYGLEDCRYADALISDHQGWKQSIQRGPVAFTAETDRVYQQKNNNRLRLQTPEGTTYLTAQGSQSCIVWNPWIEKAKRLGQFGHQDYRNMVCIETANALEDVVTVAPGQQHCLTLILSRDD
ncbi:D-hexose-6-phosphate mutarotase [Bacterioplanoides sp.]|uniref:D-hexose-6-phosphate mutarotase n=1 Tax=Bacterioplanoides sp. TaxID=2066072 RepID=UPI003AFFE5A2